MVINFLILHLPPPDSTLCLAVTMAPGPTSTHTTQRLGHTALLPWMLAPTQVQGDPSTSLESFTM